MNAGREDTRTDDSGHAGRAPGQATVDGLSGADEVASLLDPEVRILHSLHKGEGGWGDQVGNGADGAGDQPADLRPGLSNRAKEGGGGEAGGAGEPTPAHAAGEGGQAHGVSWQARAGEEHLQGGLNALVMAFRGKPHQVGGSATEPVNHPRVGAKPQEEPFGLGVLEARPSLKDMGALFHGGPELLFDVVRAGEVVFQEGNEACPSQPRARRGARDPAAKSAAASKSAVAPPWPAITERCS
eukprot:jgi/Mesvir1/4977/Mv02837-RA.1